MSTHLELLEAIHASPDEDSVRLGLADWLIEHGDESQRARGELIQIQCELARIRPEADPMRGLDSRGNYKTPLLFPRWKELDNRESAIFKQYVNTWRRGPVCKFCGGDKRERLGSFAGNVVTQRDCPHCFGTGDAGGLMREFRQSLSDGNGTSFQQVKVEYHRGMKRVHATMAECHATISAQGVGKPDKIVPSNWLLSVVRHHPDVVEVWVTDRVPANPHYDAKQRGWLRSVDTRHGIQQTPVGQATIPHQIWDALSGMNDTSTVWKWFPSTNHANTSLSRAVVKWARTHIPNPCVSA